MSYQLSQLHEVNTDTVDFKPSEGATDISERETLIKALEVCISQVSALPTLADLKSSNYETKMLANTLDKLFLLIGNIRSLYDVSDYGKIVSSRITHDIGNFINPIIQSIEGLIRNPHTVFYAILEGIFDTRIRQIATVLQANKSLCEGVPNITPSNIEDVVRHSASSAANSFLITNANNSLLIKDEEIVIDIPRDFQPYIDSSLLDLIFDNLIRNSIRVNSWKAGLRISVKPLNNDCFEIVVEDNGKGLDYEEIRLKIAQTLSQNSFGAITTPEQITQQLFRFGISASGSTGVGLSTVREAVKAHNGSLSMGNRPEGGACTRIILPNTPETNPVLRSQMVIRCKAELETR